MGKDDKKETAEDILRELMSWFNKLYCRLGIHTYNYVPYKQISFNPDFEYDGDAFAIEQYKICFICGKYKQIKLDIYNDPYSIGCSSKDIKSLGFSVLELTSGVCEPKDQQ